jgi:ribosome-associated protein YbcJ (S4-like RNA binding protein)
MGNIAIKEVITLGQFAKKVGWIDTGGMARDFLESETVLVNGERETRRGRKLYPGDTVAWSGQTVKLVGSSGNENC